MDIQSYSVKVPVRFRDTDAYGIVHHSNYYCWMEESRFIFFDSFMKESIHCLKHVPYKFPVIESHCRYIKSVSYPETVNIEMVLTVRKSAKLRFDYIIYNCKREKCAEAYTEHIYMNDEKVLLNHPEELKAFVLQWADKRKYIVLE